MCTFKTEETCMTRASPPTGPPARSIFLLRFSAFFGLFELCADHDGVTFYFFMAFFLTVLLSQSHKKTRQK